MNVLYRHIRALLCALCLLVCASAQTANVYPISLTASLLPPYSNCLGDYMSGSMDRVNVMAVMKDMSNPTGVYDIQLRMVVRQGNTRYIEASAKPHNSVTFSVARDGRMKRLANAGRLLDPANASISYSRYAKNGYCLPEGAYQIEFQAFDNRFPTLPLSEPYTLHVYLGETEPPVPVYPANNTCVPNTSGQITFSWMERTVPHISPTKKYRLQVFEVPAGAATNAVAVSEPYKRVDEVVGGTTTFATIQQTAGTFVSGHTYVWRVRSFDDADKDNNTSLRYKNQGWSDTASFRFDRCLDEGFGIVEAEGECDDLARPAIAGVETSADAALVEWTADSGSATPPDLFRIAYCLAGDSLGLWTSFDKHTGDLATLAGTGGTTVYALPLRGLEPGVAYRVRVCAVRSGADGTAACHSEADSAEFRMPLAAGTVLADCDRSVPALQCTTALTKENAPKAGDHINANGQDVKILSTEAKGEGADTRFSGQGTTTFPFLKNKLSLLVDFRDIQISCANELMKGEIVTHWDPEHNANLDFNALLNNNNMGTGPAPQQERFTSGDTATLKSGIAYMEKGANTGDVYAVGADGKVEKVAESLECTGVSTSALDYEAGTVVFSRGDGQLPPFDRNSGKFQNADIRNYYTRYGTYDVPWVAVVSGKTATLRAAFNANTDGTPVDTSKIYFVCKTQYQTVKLKSRNLDGGRYEVTVFGDQPQQRLDIYAMCADTSGNCLKALTLGKALVMTMAQRRETLVLVPVGQNAPKVDTAAIKRTLDGIYLPLGVDYTVRADKPFYTSELDGLLEEGLGITGAGLFKEETDDMRHLQSLYRQERGDSIDNTAAYIFILPKASVDGVKGDMPLTRPVGYVFASGDTYADGQTIAHELGHGLYSFQHAFDYMGVSQGETDNLMDYGLPQGEHLAVWQWNLISTHKNYTVPFLTDDEDGMYNSWEHLEYKIIPNLNTGEYHFVVKDGEDVIHFSIPEKAVDLGFNKSYLHSFTIDGERWVAFFNKNNNKFSGFFKDAVKVKNSDYYNTAKSTAYQIIKEAETTEFYFPIEKNCETHNVYKSQGVSDEKTIDSNYEALQNGIIPENTVFVRECTSNINCLKGRLKEFYKFVVDHYASHGNALSATDEDNLYLGLVKYSALKIYNVDPDSSIAGGKTIVFHEMIKNGYKDLIAELKKDSIFSTLIIKFDEPELFAGIENLIHKESVIDCLKKLDICEGDCDFSSWKIYYNLIWGKTHEKLETLQCLLDKLYISEKFWNPNHFGYTESPIIKHINRILNCEGINQALNKVVSTIITNTIDANIKEKTACVSGIWNSIIDQVKGTVDLAVELTDDSLGKNIVKFINDFKFDGLLEGITEDLKEFHGFNKNMGNDYYRTTYACCYDVVVGASFFTGVGELNAAAKLNSARKAASLALQAAKRSTEGLYKVVKKTLQATVVSGKVYLCSGAKKLAEVSDNKLIILKTAPDLSNLTYVSYEKEAVIINNKTKSCFVCFTEEGATILSELEHDLFFKWTNLLQDNGKFFCNIYNKDHKFFDHKFLEEFKNETKDIIKQFAEDDELVDSWFVFASRDGNPDFTKGKLKLKPQIRKDIESLKAVKRIRNNQDAAKLGFDDDFIAKVQGTADFAYKELLNTCDNFSKTIANRGKKLEGFDKAISNLKKGEKSCIGEEFVLRYISKNINKFPYETLSFEKEITVPGWKGKGASNNRYADVANYSGEMENMILYEFKCVKGIPPNNFAEQFCKDLTIVKGDIEKINWIFDKGKLPQNFKDKIIESIKSMDIPPQALEKLNATNADEFGEFIKDKWFNEIFIQGE